MRAVISRNVLGVYLILVLLQRRLSLPLNAVAIRVFLEANLNFALIVEHDLGGVLEAEAFVFGEVNEAFNQLVENAEQFLLFERFARGLNLLLFGEKVGLEVLVHFMEIPALLIAMNEFQNVGMVQKSGLFTDFLMFLNIRTRVGNSDESLGLAGERELFERGEKWMGDLLGVHLFSSETLS